MAEIAFRNELQGAWLHGVQGKGRCRGEEIGPLLPQMHMCKYYSAQEYQPFLLSFPKKTKSVKINIIWIETIVSVALK